MSLSLSEKLTAHFYDWEKRGRGWYTFEDPIDLEPEFVPFFRVYPEIEVKDESLRPLFGPVTKFLTKIWNSGSTEKAGPVEDSLPVQAYKFQGNTPLHIFTLSFPEKFQLQGTEAEQFLTMLSYCRYPVSFEIIATAYDIRVQIVCREPDEAHVLGQLKAYFPMCIIQEGKTEQLEVLSPEAGVVLDFGLKDEFTRPIAMPDKRGVEPFVGLFGILEHLEDKDSVVLQVLFKGTLHIWAESILRSVTDPSGDSFFADAPEMPKLAAEKVSAPLFAAGIRLVTQSAVFERAQHLMERVGNTVIQASKGTGNALIPLSEHGYPIEAHLDDITDRTTHRLGMLLNAKELATFVHIPNGIASKKLTREVRKTKPAPRIAEGFDFILGENLHQGVQRLPTLNPSQRLKHMHVIGATGTGKSTFLQSCIAQDFHLGNGVAVLDPHGDLIEAILPYIPENRISDVIIIDPADSEYPVGFNILTAHSEIEKEILASDLVAVFRRLSSSFGDQMHSVLANAILAYLESTEGGTLIDLRRFLIEKPYRQEFLKTINDPSVVYYWQKEYPLLKTNSIGPILTRLDSFLRPKVIRNMVAQKKSLDFENILNSQKILLIKLSQGLIGTENSYLLGTFFVSKIYQAAMARQVQAKDDRKNFFLYIDEFQNFITPSMSSILSGTRKYGLGCILAHQDMVQLQKQDTELASSVISNAGTRVCFRLGDIDAKRFEDGFSDFEAKDLQNLGIGEAIVRIERPEYDFTISVLQLKDVEEAQKQEVVTKAIAQSRLQYGTPKAEVEASLAYLREVEQPEDIRQPVKEVKAAEPPSKQPPVAETEVPPANIEVAPLDERQKAKTTENLVRQKELSQHRYLQTLIKKMAEARGYKATIEEPTPDGQGRVDVSLEKNNKRIACEIGVTTSKAWEVHNIEKCLDAGYEIVIAVPVDARAWEMMLKEIDKTLDSKFNSRVFVMEADALFHYLDTEVAKEATTETRIRGYRVKVEYDPVSQEEMRRKRASVTKFVVDSAKKKKDES